MDYDHLFNLQLQKLKDEGNYRVFAELERCRGNFPKAKNYIESNQTSEVTVWCSNDYLGMGQNQNVLNAIKKALNECGAGAGGTRNISGTNHYHVLLEKELADLHQKDSALLFTSGYISNWATLSTLGARLPGCTILSDEKNHASMIEGIRHSRAGKMIWRHNDPEDLRNKLSSLPADAPKIVAFESVYSMDGDIAPIDEICEVAKDFGAMTYLDALCSVKYLKSSGIERENQKRKVSYLRSKLDKVGIPHLSNPSHIVPVMIKDSVKCKQISDILLHDYSIYVQPINYPTVPKGTERLRFTPSPLHTYDDIDYLVNSLASLWKQCALSRVVA